MKFTTVPIEFEQLLTRSSRLLLLLARVVIMPWKTVLS